MASGPPPPRYRVIERGGRLVTIDTWQDEAAPVEPRQTRGRSTRSRRAPRNPIVALLCVGAADEQGHPILTTSPIYDDDGPREIPIGPKGELMITIGVIGALGVLALLLVLAVIFGEPVAVLAPFALFISDKARKGIRGYMTPRLEDLRD